MLKNIIIKGIESNEIIEASDEYFLKKATKSHINIKRPNKLFLSMGKKEIKSHQ